MSAVTDPQAVTAQNKRTHCTHLQMPRAHQRDGAAPRETETDREADSGAGPARLSVTCRVVDGTCVCLCDAGFNRDDHRKNNLHMREQKQQPVLTNRDHLVVLPNSSSLFYHKGFSLGGELKTTISNRSFYFKFICVTFFALYCGSDM